MLACPSCGFENAETAKFCSECGTALAPTPATQPRGAEGRHGRLRRPRRLDCARRAARPRGRSRDPRSVSRPPAARARAARRDGREVHRRRGRRRLRRAGRARGRSRARRSGGARDPGGDRRDERGRPRLELEVRIGVNTGEALVALGARPELGEAMVSGRRHEHRRAPAVGGAAGGILVGEQTFRATERAIEYEAEEPIAAKGKPSRSRLAGRAGGGPASGSTSPTRVAARRARRRARRARRRACPRADATGAAARDRSWASRESASRASSGSSSERRRGSGPHRTGGRAARFRTARDRRSGRSARW